MASLDDNRNCDEKKKIISRSHFAPGVTFLLTLCVCLLSLVFFLLVCLPIYLWRGIVFLLSRPLRPSLRKMLSPQSSLMANEEDLTTSPEALFVTKFILNGSPGTLRTALEDRLTQLTKTKGCEELTQCLDSWLGFYFWKDCDKSSVRQRISYDETPVTLEETKDIHKELTLRGFQRDCPLWDCVVYTNVNKGAKTAVFFRVHQCLADPTSFLGLFDELQLIPEHQGLANLVLASAKETPTLEKVKSVLRLGVGGLWNVAWDFVQQAGRSETKTKTVEPKAVEQLELEGARKMAMSNMVPPMVLGLSLAWRAVGKMLTSTEKEETPSFTLNFQMPIPIPCPIPMLSNYVVYIPIQMPPQSSSDGTPLTSIPNILKTLTDLSSDGSVMARAAFTLIVGSLNISLAKYLGRRLPLGGVQYTSYPGSVSKKSFLGLEVASISAHSGCPSSILSNSWCALNLLSYKNEVTMGLTYRPKGVELGRRVMEEFKSCQTSSPKGNSIFGMALSDLMKEMK